MSEQNWSVVLTEFEGGPKNWVVLDEAAPRIFGRPGLDAFSLIFGTDMLPAELADCLTCDEAVGAVEALHGLGGRAEAMPSADIGEVRYRTADVWATHVTDNVNFSDLEGMVFADSPLNARRNLAVLRRAHLAQWRDWQYERAMNHVHADARLHGTHAPRSRAPGAGTGGGLRGRPADVVPRHVFRPRPHRR